LAARAIENASFIGSSRNLVCVPDGPSSMASIQMPAAAGWSLVAGDLLPRLLEQRRFVLLFQYQFRR